jgi:hypothetical protein
VRLGAPALVVAFCCGQGWQWVFLADTASRPCT